MRTNGLKKVTILTLAGVSGLAIAFPAAAQDAPAAEGLQATESGTPEIEEESYGNDIIVTAKSRRESLQDVPLAVTALTTDDLNEAQITSVTDLQKVTPNLSLSISGRGDPSAMSLRGLAPNTSDERYQGISFFVDGVALSGQMGSLDMANIERVEVVKGPQSATFGRATYSGAINFITANPQDNEFTGMVRARGMVAHEAPEGSYYLGATLAGPIIPDTLWFSIAGTTFRNGAVARAPDDRSPVGREDSDILVGTLYFEPDPTFSIKLRGTYSHDKDWARLQGLQQPRDWLEAGIPVYEFERGNGSFFPEYLPDPDYNLISGGDTMGRTQDRYFLSAVVTKYLGDYELSYRGGFYYDDRWTENARVARATGPGQDPIFGDLVTSGEVTLGSTALGNPVKTHEEFYNTSHQLLLLSPGDRPIRWRVGAYYFWEKSYNYFPTLVAPGNPPDGLSTTDSIENIAGFGGLDWDFTDALTLSLEARVAREIVLSPGIATSPIAPTTLDGIDESVNFTPRVTLSYDITPDNMVYALYSSGVKSARFSRVNFLGDRVPIAARPEKLENFEVGSKNSFWNRRLVLNLAGFYQKVKDQQLTALQQLIINGQDISSTIVSNVGASDIWGFEVEATLRPIRNLTLQGNVGYAHQEFTTKEPIILSPGVSYGFPPAPGGAIVIDGLQQANVPDWNGYVSGEYVWPNIMGDFSAAFRMSGIYRGGFYPLLNNITKVRSSWTADTRLSFYNDAFEFALFGRNIFFNKRATQSSLAGAVVGCAFIESDTETYGTNQQCIGGAARRPPEWGAEVTFRF